MKKILLNKYLNRLVTVIFYGGDALSGRMAKYKIDDYYYMPDSMNPNLRFKASQIKKIYYQMYDMEEQTLFLVTVTKNGTSFKKIQEVII